MRKTSLFILLAVFLAVAMLVGCAPEEEVEEVVDEDPEEVVDEDPEEEVEEIQEITIAIGSAMPEGSVLYDAGVMFEEAMEERSDGKISVNRLFAGAAGDEEAVTEAVAMGSLEGMISGPTFIDMFAPGYNVFVPFTARGFDHLTLFLESEYGDVFMQEMEENGNIRIIDYLARGQRYLASPHEVRLPEDYAGVSHRVAAISEWNEAWEAVGANPVGVSMTEIYTSLATGVVDGACGDLSNVIGYNYYEVTDYLVTTKHMPMLGWFAYNVDFLNDLNEPTRDLILQVSHDVADDFNATLDEREGAYLQELEEEYGMTIIDLTEEERDAWFEAASPAVQNFFEDFDLTYDEWVGLLE